MAVSRESTYLLLHLDILGYEPATVIHRQSFSWIFRDFLVLVPLKRGQCPIVQFVPNA